MVCSGDEESEHDAGDDEDREDLQPDQEERLDRVVDARIEVDVLPCDARPDVRMLLVVPATSALASR